MFGRAAELAYFLLFSLVPILLMTTVILGFVYHGEQLQRDLLGYLQRAIPGASFTLVRTTFDQITTHAGGGKLSLGIVATLWAASSGMTAIIEGLNKAYEVREERPWWRARLLAAVLTLGLSVLIIVALAILFYGAQLGALIAKWAGLGSAFQPLWQVVEWILLIGFPLLAFLLVYRFAPNLHRQRWWWILPGAVVGVALWFLVSIGLRIYFHFFNSYATVYGAMGAALILLLWLYLSSAALLIGGEFNSEIENAAASNGAPDAKRPGEKEPGRRTKPQIEQRR